jgi:hypothetical protein
MSGSDDALEHYRVCHREVVQALEAIQDLETKLAMAERVLEARRRALADAEMSLSEEQIPPGRPFRDALIELLAGVPLDELDAFCAQLAASVGPGHHAALALAACEALRAGRDPGAELDELDALWTAAPFN